MLMVDPRAIVLTSRSAAAVWAGPWSSAESDLQRAPPGPFDEQLQQSLAGDLRAIRSGGIVESPGNKSPWRRHGRRRRFAERSIMPAGRSTISIFPTPRQIGIVDRDMMLVVGCGICLLAVLLVFAKGDVSWKHQGIALSCADGDCAVGAGEVVRRLGAGLWLGLAAGWMLRSVGALGPAARSLFAPFAPAAAGTAACWRTVLCQLAPASDPGDTTFPRLRLSPRIHRLTAIRKASAVHRRVPAVRRCESAEAGGPDLGLLLVVGCLAWHDAGAAEPQAGSANWAGMGANKPCATTVR